MTFLQQAVSPLRKLYSKALPSGENFYALFLKHAELGCEASKEYRDYFYNSASWKNSSSRKLSADQVKALEKQADSVKREINQALHSTYMIPFDRSQIANLTECTDKTLGRMKKVVERVDRYKLDFKEPMLEMAGITHECAQLFVESVGMLHDIRGNYAAIRAKCEKIRQNEKRADSLFETISTEIFDLSDLSEASMLRYERVYELMEEAVDSYETAADAIEDILVDYR